MISFGLTDKNLRLAQFALAQDRYAQAEILLTENLKKSNDLYARLYLTQALHYQKKSEEALGLLQNILKQSPPEPEIVQYYTALIYFDLDQYRKCLSEIEKIKQPNFFHIALRDSASIFENFANINSQKYLTLLNCRKASFDIQARVLLKLEHFLPINLTKRSFKSLYQQQRNFLWLKETRKQHQLTASQKKLELALKQAAERDYTKALEYLQEAFQIGVNLIACEEIRLKISEKIIADETFWQKDPTALPPAEIAWSYFFTQQFQKGIQYALPFLQKKPTPETYRHYLELLEVTGYQYFSLGQFPKAQELFTLRVNEKKDNELASYFYAASLQHSHQTFPALNAYRSFLQSHLDAYHLQLNIAFETLNTTIPLTPL